MRAAPALALLLLATGARAEEPRPPVEARPPLAPLPLPSAGKAARAAAGQRSFRVPLGFAPVERFYRDRLGADPEVRLVLTRAEGRRTLTLTSRRAGDAWARAVVREASAVDTQVDVTPVVRLQAEQVAGRVAAPLVQFVLPVSPEVKRQADTLQPARPAPPPPPPAR